MTDHDLTPETLAAWRKDAEHRRFVRTETASSTRVLALLDALAAEKARTERAHQAAADPHEYEWAEILTHQECENGEHPDWFMDTEHNIRCPFCALAAETTRAEQAERNAREAALLDAAGRFADHHRVTYTGAEVAAVLRLLAAHPD